MKVSNTFVAMHLLLVTETFSAAALKALADRFGLHLVTAMAEPKLPACSWLLGDTLGNSVYSPCAVQEKAYLYGMNSTHLAASAADNHGSKYVTCELFRDYNKLTTDIVYKDAMNAPHRFVVYCFVKGQKLNLNNPKNIVEITSEPFYRLPKEMKGKYVFVVTVLDRMQNESKGIRCKVNL